MTAIKLAIVGVSGRLGLAALRAGLSHPDIHMAGGVVSRESLAGGQDLGALVGRPPIGVLARGDLAHGIVAADVVLDVSQPAGTRACAQACAAGSKALVTGVTGLDAEAQAAVEAAAEKVAVVQADNFSLGVALLERLVAQAAQALGPDWDIEIAETHHRRKVDAPSGTALLLGRAAAQGRGVTLEDKADYGARAGARKPGGIGFAVSRGGGVVGEHAVRLVTEDEEIALSHRAFDRALFAKGALAACLWVKDQSPGLYRMADVLGL
ncbi:MAG: 4-hydroxy-tetrahydrodipicolinate reductase [Maricaulaceae bacterium]